MKKAFIFLMLWIGAIILSSAYAVELNSVYSADVPVASQSNEDRVKAEGPALAQVLVKLSGNTDIAKNSSVADRLKKADRLVQQFEYKPSPETPATPYILHVEFDEDGVNHILRDESIPTWGENRPLILTWVSYESPGQVAEVVGGDTEITIQNILKKHANERGLPILLPMMDITDINQVNVNDIVTMSIPSLVGASKRYENDAMLIMRILKDVKGYSTQAKLIKGTDTWDWNINGDTLDNVISQVMNNATNALAGRYASVVSNEVKTEFTLKVTGVTQQNDLAALMDYLKNLAPVADVQPINVASDEVLLTVSLRGAQQAFIQAVAGEDKLQPVSGITAEPNTLVYQWNP